MHALMLALALTFATLAPARAADDPAQQAFGLFHGDAAERRRALDAMLTYGRADAAPALILALRFVRGDARPLVRALEKLTGAKPGDDWADWMLWQEAHPEIGAMPGFARLHARVHDFIDPNFQIFLAGDKPHEIRIEEIVWGGVVKDGIPALTRPRLIAAGEAGYLGDDDLVFGVAINGDVRAYPLRIMDWHEMFNDVVGGVPVSLAYCTLCGSGILFETTLARFSEPLIFGSSGFLYRSNKLMYDTRTHSLWNQFTGRPVLGPLTGSGIELRTRPVAIERWGAWRKRHPQTRVLALDTGHRRDYGAGAAYGRYFASPELMFPTRVDQSRLKQKDYVFALRSTGSEKAWPLDLFRGGAVVNDSVGILGVVLTGDAASRTVRAYRSDGLAFGKGATSDTLRQGDAIWRVTEEALLGPDGRSLARLPGHIAYWFAWSGYFGKDGEVASGRKTGAPAR